MPMHDISTLIYCINTFSGKQSVSETEPAHDFDTFESSADMEPSEASIQSILNFARSYEVIETENAGYIEMILN